MKIFITIGLLLGVTLAGCMVLDIDIVQATGKVIYIELEGGFFGILADSGGRYQPINLPSEFKQDGIHIRFEGRIRDDISTIHMWGKPIELIHIERT